MSKNKTKEVTFGYNSSLYRRYTVFNGNSEAEINRKDNYPYLKENIEKKSFNESDYKDRWGNRDPLNQQDYDFIKLTRTPVTLVMG